MALGCIFIWRYIVAVRAQPGPILRSELANNSVPGNILVFFLFFFINQIGSNVQKCLQVVAKDERPALSGSLTPIEMRLADLYQKCWSPRLKERPDMFKIIHTLDNL